MIVCCCNVIREEDLRTAVRRGAPCPRTAYRSLGCDVQCGSCLPCAQEIVDDEREELLSVDAKAAA